MLAESCEQLQRAPSTLDCLARVLAPLRLACPLLMEATYSQSPYLISKHSKASLRQPVGLSLYFLIDYNPTLLKVRPYYIKSSRSEAGCLLLGRGFRAGIHSASATL